ncbi:MAG: restriction endonuclease subunit S [Conexivisphaerales archaeon]
MMFYKETNFKETPIGKIPRDWKIMRLENIGKIVNGFGFPIEYQGKKAEKYIFVKVSDTNLPKNEKYIFTAENTIDDDTAKKLKARIYPAGTIIFPKIGMVIYLRKVRILAKAGTFDNNIMGIIPDEKLVGREFLYYYFLERINLTELAGRTTAPSIRKSEVEKLKISLPPLPEQHKIAEVLSTVDEAIRRTGEVIAKTERLKKGLMQTLLTRGIGHKEFKDTEIGRIPKEWEVVRLGSVAEFKNGINFIKEQKGDKGILTVDVLNMYGKSIYLDFTNLYRVNTTLKDISEYLLEKGDILFVRSSLKREGVGWVSLFDGWNEPVTFCGFIIRARLKTTTILPEFLTHFLRSDFARNRLIASSGQVAITNVTQELLKILRVPLPPLEEQRKITEILSSVDKKLEVERNEKTKLERIKQGLMDLLLTGKIRVKVN